MWDRFKKWRHKYQRQIHRWLTSIAFILFLLRATGLLPSFISDSVVVLLVAYILVDIGDNTYPTAHIEAYNEQRESDEVLKEWVKNKRPRKAIIIDYTSHTIRDFLRYLLDYQVQIDLYLQTVQTVQTLGIQRQHGLLLDGLKELYVDFNEELKSGQLKILFYNVLPSILGVRLDNEILCVGWYMWEPIFDENATQDENVKERIRNLRSRKQQLSDKVRLWGHTKPRIIVYKNTPQFEVFDGMFTSQVDHFNLYNEINQNSKEFDEMKFEAIIAKSEIFNQTRQSM